MTEPGWVQKACLRIIRRCEKDGRWPSIYDIAAGVYRIKPDNGVQLVSSAQQTVASSTSEIFCRWRGGMLFAEQGPSPTVCETPKKGTPMKRLALAAVFACIAGEMPAEAAQFRVTKEYGFDGFPTLYLEGDIEPGDF